MNDNVISILEYQESKELSKIELKEIENINKSIGVEIFTLTSKNTIKAKQYVGVIQIGKKSIEVLPKIFSTKEKFQEEDKLEQTKIRKNLLYMLSYTKKLKLKETDISSLSKNSNIYEAIIYLFAKNLLELLKTDLVKTYETKEENNSFLKGKLLFSKHLKLNVFNRAKFYSEYDEFTENNLLNQLFKATTDKLLKFTSNTTNFKLLTESNLILEEINLRKLTIFEIEKINFNRLNAQYEDIFNLAKLLYFGNSVELHAKEVKSYSLMFDMNKLFEEFIFEFIKRECNYKKYLIQTEKPSKYLFLSAPKFQLKPDITFYDGEICKLIIDTKYKFVNDFKSEKYGISREDIYQMFVYSQIYKCENIILLYPQYETKLNDKISFSSNYKFNVIPRTVNLHIDIIKEKETLKNELNEILNII